MAIRAGCICHPKKAQIVSSINNKLLYSCPPPPPLSTPSSILNFWIVPPPPEKHPLLSSYLKSTLIGSDLIHICVFQPPTVLLALSWPRWLRLELKINVFPAPSPPFKISFWFSDFAVDCGRNCGLWLKWEAKLGPLVTCEPPQRGRGTCVK